MDSQRKKKSHSDELFKAIVRKIYTLKAERELVPMVVHSEEAKKIDELYKKKIVEMDHEHVNKMKDVLVYFNGKKYNVNK